MRGQGAAHRLAADPSWANTVVRWVDTQGCVILGGPGLQLLQLQLQLVQQLAPSLGRGAELLAPEFCNQQLEVGHHRLGLTPGQLLGRKCCAQGGDVIREGVGAGDHARQ